MLVKASPSIDHIRTVPSLAQERKSSGLRTACNASRVSFPALLLFPLPPSSPSSCCDGRTHQAPYGVAVSGESLGTNTCSPQFDGAIPTGGDDQVFLGD